MKPLKKDVLIITEKTPSGTISYSDEEYMHSASFQYQFKHLKKGKSGIHTIYGVTKTKGRTLLNYWNMVGDGVWEFQEMEDDE